MQPPADYLRLSLCILQLVATEGFDNTDDSRPDPSFETDPLDEPVWRHPSEIGAMMAAANGGPVPQPRGRHPVGLISLGASLALIAVIVLSLASPGPGSNTLVASEQATTISKISLASTTVPPTSAPAPFYSHDGVMRIERWGGAGKAQGNGVMIYDDGYIATSRKLIAGATQLVVTAPDGQTYDAEIVGGDFILDIAVLKIDANDLSVAAMTDSDPSRGDLVHIADTWSTSTSGSPVLATDKVVADDNGFHRQELLEFDSPVGQQSAGAPLMNDSGDVVAMLLPVDQSGPYNYALDISAVRLAAHQIIESGFVKHVAWIGIKGRSVEQGKGIRVDEVVEDSPADAAGIEEGDTIITVARYNVSDMKALWRTLDNLASRQITEITLMRGGEMIAVDITLGIRAQIKG